MALKAIIVGLGQIGLGYDLAGPKDRVFTHTRACMLHPDVELIAGIDVDPERRTAFQYYSSSNAYPSIEVAEIEAGVVDLVIVSTPVKNRLPVVTQCFDLKPKAILLEKPIADNMNDAVKIVEMAENSGVVLVVNYFRRFDKATRYVAQLIRQKHYGIVRQAACIYSGGLLDMASHYVDMFRMWFGKPSSMRPLGIVANQQIGDSGISFQMEYSDFSATFFHLAADYNIGEVDLLFERGRIRFENYGEDLLCYEVRKDPFFPDYNRLAETNPGVDHSHLLRYQYEVLDGICEGLTHQTTIDSSGNSALTTLNLCLSLLNR